MKKIFEVISKIIPALIIFIFVCGLNDFANGKQIYVHDTGLFFSKQEVQIKLGNYWNNNNFGYPDYSQISTLWDKTTSALLLSSGFSSKFVFLAIYFINLVIVWYSSYYGFKIILNNRNKIPIPVLLATFFYTFNLVMLSNWHGGIGTNISILWGIMPWIYIQFSHNNKNEEIVSLNSVLSALLLSICLAYGPFFLAVLISFLISFFLTSLNKVKYSIRWLITILLSAVMGMYFVVGNVLTLCCIDPGVQVNGLSAYKFSNTGIMGFFRLFFDWTINQQWGGRMFQNYYQYFSSPVVIVSIFIIWIMIIITYSRTNSKRVSKLIPLLLIIIISIFISKNIQYPFGFINEFLYKYIPLMGVFRTPDTKFAIPFIFALSVLIGNTYLYFSRSVFRYLLIICTVINILPFFNPKSIIEINSSEKFDKAIEIPIEYEEIAKIINNSKWGYVLLIPGLSYGDYRFDNSEGVSGQDILGKILNKPVLYSDGVVLDSAKKHIANISKNISTTIFQEYGIRFIGCRKDIIFSTLNCNHLKSNKSIHTVYSSNVIDLFETNQDPAKNIEITQDGGSSNQKNNNTNEYSFQVTQITNNLQFTLNQSYHPGWVAKIHCNNDGVDQKYEIKSFSDDMKFGNLWILNKANVGKCFDSNGKAKEIDVKIVFSHINSINSAAAISVITIVSSIGYLIFYKRIKKHQ